MSRIRVSKNDDGNSISYLCCTDGGYLLAGDGRSQMKMVGVTYAGVEAD